MLVTPAWMAGEQPDVPDEEEEADEAATALLCGDGLWYEGNGKAMPKGSQARDRMKICIMIMGGGTMR